MKSQMVPCIQSWPKRLLLLGLLQLWAACADSTPGALPKDPSGTVVGAAKMPNAARMTPAESAGMSAPEQAAGAPAAGGGAGRNGSAGAAAGRRGHDDEEDDD